jgi:hypothetical protein
MSATRRLGIILAVVVLALALVGGIGWTALNPHRGQARVDDSTLPLDEVLSRDDALRDLDFVVETIRERHVWAVDGLPPAVATSWQAERDALPSRPTVLDVWRASSRILVALGDGHTFVGVPSKDYEHFDIDYVMVDGDLHVDMEGVPVPVRAINGVPAAHIVETNRQLTPADNDGWRAARLLARLQTDDGLALLGAPARGSYRVELAGPGYRFLAVAPDAEPVAREAPPAAGYEVDDRLAVLTVRRCEPDDQYEDVLESFFGEVAARGLERIVVDLRGNPGGDSRVTDLFVEYLDVGRIPSGSTKGRYGPWLVPLGDGTMQGRRQDPAFGGAVVVLTDHATFSSAADFATVLSDNGLATIVGEPPGSAPTGAGDIVVFRLPVSGLFMQVSYKEFVRADPTRGRSELHVDVPADPSGTVEQMLG